MRRNNTSNTKPNNSNTLVAMTDSIGHPGGTLGVLCSDCFPERIAEYLRSNQNCALQMVNQGVSGQTSGQLLARIGYALDVSRVSRKKVADGVIIEIGVNDNPTAPGGISVVSAGTTATATTVDVHGFISGMSAVISGASVTNHNGTFTITVTSPTTFTYTIPNTTGTSTSVTATVNILSYQQGGVSQTQLNIEGAIRATRSGVTGYAVHPSQLPADEAMNALYVVHSDNSTTGGVATQGNTLYSTQPATVTGTQSGVRMWICRTGAGGETGWSRVADQSRGCQRVAVMNTHYLNFSTGGDLPGAQSATRAAIKAAQTAAATAQTAPLLDIWNYQAQLISKGISPQDGLVWSYILNNQHPNKNGSDVIAQAAVSEIVAKAAAWIKDWK